MTEQKGCCRIIAIYSKKNVHGKIDYVLNFATALAKVTADRVMLVDMSLPYGTIKKLLRLGEASNTIIINTGIGIDVLNLERFKEEDFEQTINRYKYAIINLPFEIDETILGILSRSDTIHFFIDSTKSSIEDGYRFLEDLRKKGLSEINNKLKIVANRLNIFNRFSSVEISWLLKREVWAVVPETSILEPSIDSKGIPIVLKSETSLYSKAVLYIAKKETGRLLGLALGSGAAFGLAHIGVLKVFEEHKIPIDIISGSSMGALIASLYGIGFSSEKIENFANKLKNKLNIMRLLDFTVPLSGILAGKRLKRFLKSILGEKTFEDLQIPVKIIVYDLANRETIVLEDGLLVDSVYKSIAVPGIFSPIIEKERLIIDGGVSDPVPVEPLLKQEVKKIIAVNVLPSPEDMYRRNMSLKRQSQEEENILMRRGFFGLKLRIMVRRFFRKIFTPNIFDVIMSSMQSLEYKLAEDSCKKADIVLHPVFINATSVDFQLVKQFIECGEKETRPYISKIEKLALR